MNIKKTVITLIQSLLQIWKNKHKILEGIKNSIFGDPFIKEVSKERMLICKSCKKYDETGSGCIVLGTSPCCSILKGGCGCSLKVKTKSLSSDCPVGKWGAVDRLEEEKNI